jgi:hypothetical protein
MITTLFLEIACGTSKSDHAASAARFRSTIRREEADTSIADAVSNALRVRHTVSMVNPR